MRYGALDAISLREGIYHTLRDEEESAKEEEEEEVHYTYPPSPLPSSFSSFPSSHPSVHSQPGYNLSGQGVGAPGVSDGVTNGLTLPP